MAEFHVLSGFLLNPRYVDALTPSTIMIDQDVSWVNLSGNGKTDPKTNLPIVGQIYFQTDESQLDDQDEGQIESIAIGIKRYFAAKFGPHLKPFQVGLVGYADHRGSEAYNLNLSLKRAKMVQSALDVHFMGERGGFYWRTRYQSIARGGGEGMERNPSLLHKDRRVNIVMARTYRAEIEFPPVAIHIQPRRQDLSRTFLMRTRGGVSLEAPYIAIGVQVLKVTVRNTRNGREVSMTFTGTGASMGLPIPIGINRPTDFEQITTPYYMEVTDFLGEGAIVSAGILYGSNVYEFYGPLQNGVAPAGDVKSNRPLVIKTSAGWDLNQGVGRVEGFWERD